MSVPNSHNAEDVIDGLKVIQRRRGQNITLGDIIIVEQAIQLLERQDGPYSRDDVLEEVAKWYQETGFYMDEDDVAPAIRALKGTPQPEAGAERDGYKEAIAQNLKLRKALEQCVRVTRQWHAMPQKPGDDDAFDLYFNHSPEMKLIRDALGKMPDESCATDRSEG